MLTVTINNDKDLITITSDLIDDYIAALPSKPKTLSLLVKVNCTTEYEFDLDDTTLDLINSEFTLAPADLGADTTFTNSVVSFELTETTVATGSTEVQTACLFIDFDLQCQIISYIADNITSTDNVILVQALYDVLPFSNTCSDCECEDACIIFDYLTSFIGGTNTTNNCVNCG